MTAHNPAIDPKLLALLTGELGNSQQLDRICNDIGQVLSNFLPDLIETETGLKFNFHYESCESGLKDRKSVV
jgi:flagellar motor switch protein FliM